MILMYKNTPVLQFDVDKNQYNILDSEKMPLRMRNCLWNKEDTNSKMHNYNVLIDYLSSRMLDISRENAKKILNAFHYTQSQSPIDKARIAISCRGVSATDSYWLCLDKDLGCISWESVDPKRNSLNRIVTHIALCGSSLSLTGNPHTPELTNHGSYAKAWIREEDGLYLYKRDTKGNMEGDIEVSVSNILDCCNVEHVRYEKTNFEGAAGFCKCKNMCMEQLDIVTAEDYSIYCNRQNIDFMQQALKIDADSLYKMCIVDYLISNADRHMQNWGFYMNNETGHLLCCHPLFDHNNAFDPSVMENPDGGDSLVFPNKTKKEAAQYCIKKCDFHFIKEPKRSMFVSPEMYQSFVSRAKELGLCREKALSFREKIFRKGPILEYTLGKEAYKDYDKLIQDDTAPKNVLDQNIQEAKEACKTKVEKNRNQTLER